jgi:apolipoprotein N-acyltransferase
LIREHIDKQKLFFAFLSGLILALSFPPHGVPWFAWIALVPLFYSTRDLSFKKSFYTGLLAGLVHYIMLLYWLVATIGTYGHVPVYLCIPVLLLLSVYLALYIGAFTASVSFLSLRPAAGLLVIPALWVCLEYIRSFILSGFPWGLIGYSQYEYLKIIQISDMCGVYGVSFLVVLSNTAVFLVLTKVLGNDWYGRKIRNNHAAVCVLFSVLMVAGAYIYGEKRMKRIDALIKDARTIKLSVVQGNINQAIKWDRSFQRQSINTYIRLSVSAKNKPDIIVWPETATPFYFLYDQALTDMVKEGIFDTGSDFLIGSPSFVQKDDLIEFYNSAYLMGSKGDVYGKYDKSHLVPFGEYIPFGKYLPFLNKMVEGVGDFKSGEKGKVLQWQDLKLGIQICYEVIFPDLSAALVRNDAALLINITNDAWYGRSSAPYQHFSMAVFRAVENRRSLVRSANTGISGLIDPCGRVIDRTEIFNEAVITRAMPVMYKKSIYTQYGDIFAVVCVLFVVLNFITRKNK